MELSNCQLKLVVLFIFTFSLLMPAYSNDIEILKKECREGNERSCWDFFLQDQNNADQAFLTGIVCSRMSAEVRETALNRLVFLSEPLTADTKACLRLPFRGKQSDWEKNARKALLKEIPYERWPNIEWENGIETDWRLKYFIPPGRYNFNISYSNESFGGTIKFSSKKTVILKVSLDLDTAYCIYSGVNWNFWNPSISAICKGATCNSIIKKDISLEARKAAIERITDQSTISELVKNIEEDEEIRCAAIGKITDKVLLSELAKNDKSKEVRILAAMTADDQNMLIAIAKTDDDSSIRSRVVECITDQAALYEIATTDKDTFVRMNAVKKITDEIILIKIAKTNVDPVTDSFVRPIAIEKITDQSVLYEIAKTEKSWTMRKNAVEQLTDSILLTEIIKNDKDPEVSSAARKRLTYIEKTK